MASSKSSKQLWLSRIQRRLQLGLFLKTFVDYAVVFCMIAGCLILASKIFWPQAWPHISWGLLAVIPVAATAWWYSRQRPFRDEQSVAMLDQRIGAGGLLMTVVETPDDQWEQQLPAAQQIWQKSIPKWRPIRALKHLAIPVAFLLFTCVLPPRVMQSMGITPSTLSSNEVSNLKDMLKELEENEILKEDEKAELNEQINKLSKETRFKPLTHENWETVDALKKTMELKLANRENLLEQTASALMALERSIDNKSSDVGSNKKRLEDLLKRLKENENSKSSPSASGKSKDGEEDGDGQEGDGKENKDGSESENAGNSENDSNGEGQPLPNDLEDLRAALEELKDYIEDQAANMANVKEVKLCDCEECPEGGS